MIDPTELVDNLVEKLRAVPELLDLMEGDAESIFAYYDRYPTSVSIANAIVAAPAPSIMIVWNGLGAHGFGDSEVWQHALSAILKANPAFEMATDMAYAAMMRAILDGVPGGKASGEQAMKFHTIHPDCQPMTLPADVSRHRDAADVDYFEMQLLFDEISG